MAAKKYFLLFLLTLLASCFSRQDQQNEEITTISDTVATEEIKNPENINTKPENTIHQEEIIKTETTSHETAYNEHDELINITPLTEKEKEQFFSEFYQ